MSKDKKIYILIVGPTKRKLPFIGNLNQVHFENADHFMVIMAWRSGPKLMVEFYMIFI